MMTLGLGDFCSIEDVGPTKFVQMMIRLTSTYFNVKVKFASLICI